MVGNLQNSAISRNIATKRRQVSSIAHRHRAGDVESAVAAEVARVALRRIARGAADRASTKARPLGEFVEGLTDGWLPDPRRKRR